MTVPEVAKTSAAQSVVYNITYKGGTAQASPAFVIPTLPLAALSAVSNITTTTVRVELATAPTADYTLTDASKFAILVDGTPVAPTAITKYAADTTNKSYTLTIPTLANKQGSLTVNGVAPATKPATGSEYDYDFKAPSLVSATPIDQNHIRVTYSEKMDASAIDVAQVSLIKNSDTTATNLLSFGVLSADKKSVVFTTNANLVPANYTFKVTGTVKDLQNNATYKVLQGSEVYFTAEANSLTDVTPPTLVSATYNSETSKLILNFDENITVATIDKSKFKLGGVALTAADSLTESANSTTLTFTLSAATKAALPTGSLSLAIEAGAVTDAATTVNPIVAKTVDAVTLQTPPALVTAESNYNESTQTLTLKFDQAVKIPTISNIRLGNVALATTTNRIVSPSTIATVASNTVTIVLDPTEAANAAIGGNTAATIALEIPVNTGIVNVAGTAISTAITANIAMTQDTVKPSLVSAKYSNLDSCMYLEFTEPVQVDNTIAMASFKIDLGDGNGLQAVSAANIVAGGISAVDVNGAALVSPAYYSKYVKVNFAGGGANATVQAGGNVVLTALQNAYNAGKTMKIALGAGAVYDYAGLQTAAVTSNSNEAMSTGINLEFVNTLIPTLTTVDGAGVVTNTQFTATFSARMAKADIENVNNWTLTDLMSNTPVTITSIVQDTADAKIAYITSSTPLTKVAGGGGYAYKLAVSNVKSVDGIAITSTQVNKEFEFNGTATVADTTKPVIKAAADDGVALTINAGKENDIIVVTYTEANGMDKASTETLANYTLVDLGTDGSGSTAITLDSNTVKSIALGGAAPNQTVTITLKTIDLQKDHSYSFTVGTGVKDIYGNYITSADAKNTKTIPVVASQVGADDVNFVNNDVAFAGANALGSVTTGQTAVTVTFAEDVTAATASVASNYRIKGAGATLLVPTTVTFDAATNKATFTVAEALAGPTFEFYVKGIRDRAGNVPTYDREVSAANVDLGTGTPNFKKYTTGVVADLTPPAFAATNTITAVANDQLAADTQAKADVITLKFDSAVSTATAENELNYVVKVNGTTLAAAANLTYATPLTLTTVYAAELDTVGDPTGKTVKIYLNNAAGLKNNFYKGDTIEVTAANIEDAVGNKMASAAVNATVTAADVATNTAMVATDVVIATKNTIEVTFADDLLASTVDAADLLVENNVVTKAVASAAKVVTLTVAAPIQPGANVKVSASDTYAMKDAEGNDLVKASIFGATNPGITSAATAPTATDDAPTLANLQIGEGNVTAGGYAAAGVGETIAWTSSDTSKATINATTGAVTPVAAGTTTISYTITTNATGYVKQSGSLAVTVNAAATDDAPTVGVLQVGEGDVTAAGYVAVGVGETMTWASTDALKASVTNAGVVSPAAAGSTTLSYKIVTNATGVVKQKGSLAVTVNAAATAVNPTYAATLKTDNSEDGATPANIAAINAAVGDGQTIAWTSGTPGNITVNATTGAIAATGLLGSNSSISYKIVTTATGVVAQKGAATVTLN